MPSLRRRSKAFSDQSNQEKGWHNGNILGIYVLVVGTTCLSLYIYTQWNTLYIYIHMKMTVYVVEYWNDTATRMVVTWEYNGI